MYSKPNIPTFISVIVSNTTYQFWFLQLMYWFGLSVISFISLTLWYAEADWQQTAHTILQSIEGLAISMALHYIFRASWNKSLPFRITIHLISILVAATLWTAIRMLTFLALIFSEELWQDFGGWYFSSIVVFLAWSALYYGFNYYKLLQKEHENALHAQTMAKEAQLKMLRYQLNPHFLFNTLNAVSALIKLDESKKAKSMLQKLSNFLRLVLDIDPVKPITLAQEVSILSMYLNIEKVRFSERLKISFELSEQAKSALIPSFILQPLIENSIKYAIEPYEKGGHINIIGEVKQINNNDFLKIVIVDEGPGMQSQEESDLSDNRGVGLRNTVERLEMAYPGNHEFKTCNAEPTGLRIKMIIPYQTSENQLHKDIPIQQNAVHSYESPLIK